MEYKWYPVFRFDDVCINADMKLINDITDYIREFYSGKVEIIWGISPLVHDMTSSIGLSISYSYTIFCVKFFCILIHPIRHIAKYMN